MAGDAVALRLRRVVKEYGGGVRALAGVDLTIDRGEAVAIVGPSGSGKTTLLQINGHARPPDRRRRADRRPRCRGVQRRRAVGPARTPDRLRLPAVPSHRRATGGRQRRRRPALQRPRAQRAAGARPRRARQRRARRRMQHRPNEMSGGERQRTAIARAIAGAPAIVFADEPTGNLDSRTGAEIVALLRALNSGGSTLVVITHDADVSQSFPRQVHMRDGAIVHDSAALQPAVA